MAKQCYRRFIKSARNQALVLIGRQRVIEEDKCSHLQSLPQTTSISLEVKTDYVNIQKFQCCMMTILLPIDAWCSH